MDRVSPVLPTLNERASRFCVSIRGADDDVAQPVVAVAYGSAIVRAALAQMLRLSGYDVCGDESLEWISAQPAGTADLCLLLADEPDGNVDVLIRRVHDCMHSAPIVVLSPEDDSERILATLYAGAKGFINSDVDDDALLCAIEAVMAGSTVIYTHQPISERLHELGYEPGAFLLNRLGLTQRELQVLRLLATGRSTAQVAATLYLAPKTIENYLTRIYAKLGVRSRSEAVAALLNERPGQPTD